MTGPDKVLVIGGAGYIGSHVCKLLARSGFTPITVDHLNQGHRELVKWGPLIEADVRKPLPDLKSTGAVAAIHFAARIEVGESVVDPLGFFDNNVAGSINLLRALPERLPIIFSSTAAVYGEPPIEHAMITETTPLRPINPYGTSKLMVEQVLRDLWAHRQWPSVILRYFNVIGADPDLDTGEWHEPETHLLPRILNAARLNQPAKIFGADYATEDGTCVRDYVDVCDLARAHLDALRWVLGNQTHDVFNVGYSRGTSVLEMLKAVEDARGVTLKREAHPRRAGDPARLVADGAKARRVLGWTPQYEGRLSDSVRRAWAWDERLTSIASTATPK